MLLLAHTLEMIGTVLVAFAALRVHHRVLNEHKIDRKVFGIMKREQKVGMLGVGLVIIAYLIKVLGV